MASTTGEAFLFVRPIDQLVLNHITNQHADRWHSTPDIEQSTDSEGDSQGSEGQEDDAAYYEEEEDPQELEGPSFTVPVPPETWSFDPLPVLSPGSASTPMEEAFQKAKDASYALGYWTAVYQMHAQQQKQRVSYQFRLFCVDMLKL